MKPMLMVDAESMPLEGGWLYETKYDGFRCLLEWTHEGIRLHSRNEKRLDDMFPEIVAACERLYEKAKPFMPLWLDGEIVHLRNDFASEFLVVQTRGRMRKKEVIEQHADSFPCKFAAFDLLEIKGEDQKGKPLKERKHQLAALFESLELPGDIDYTNRAALQMIHPSGDGQRLWSLIRTNNGEGLIAKREASKWNNERRTNEWLKVKNWRTVTVLVTKYENENGFFTGSIYQEGQLVDVVTFKHGMTEEEHDTTRTLFMTKGKLQAGEGRWELTPSICAVIECISFDGKHLREPRFKSFEFGAAPEDCRYPRMLRELNPVPVRVAITHPDKPVWPEQGIVKDDYLYYLQEAAPYMLPFLKDRLLTVIRYPHGTGDEKFYQKNAPDSAPDFVRTGREDGIDYVICDGIETLLWLGNQLALELHIPFQKANTKKPSEIVFDLDPPSVGEFQLAVEAAVRLKAIFDQFKLKSFVKTSGGKGLQLYIPLPENQFSYEETRIFTKFVSDFLCSQEPLWFTTERLKKNRGGKLYVDYVQHHEGKTIIAPYSTRGRELATVATPLEWSEVKEGLHPEQFTIPDVLVRMRKAGNPFRAMREAGDRQEFGRVVEQLKSLLH